MTHASLFSGIGGAELAAQWMGWENIFHCEIQEFPRRVLEYHFPKSVSYADITKTDFREWRGRIDVLTGGFPCQPFSYAGKRGGADDSRYLWPEMLRAIREIQPTWVVGENVTGLATMVQPSEAVKVGRTDDLFEPHDILRSEHPYTLTEILDSLEREGYSVQTFNIPACAVGAPHERQRLWIVAHADHNRQGNGQNKQECIAGSGREADVSGHVQGGGFSADTFRERWSKSQFHNGNIEEAQQEERGEQQPCGADSPQDRWREFPTQSPVCSGNDGLSSRLDTGTVSFAKWREESIKAAGNAWVPQVAYEIFKAIEEYEKI